MPDDDPTDPLDSPPPVPPHIASIVNFSEVLASFWLGLKAAGLPENVATEFTWRWFQQITEKKD